MGLDQGAEAHKVNIGRSKRSAAVVEPMLSTQWIVKIKSLAGPSLAAAENRFIEFVPAQLNPAWCPIDAFGTSFVNLFRNIVHPLKSTRHRMFHYESRNG